MRVMHAVAAKFDLVAVRSAGVDRRVLSEAWYSALHLASCRRIGGRQGETSCGNAQRRAVPDVAPAARDRKTVAIAPPHRRLSTAASRREGDARIEESSPVKRVDRRQRASSLESEIAARLRSHPQATRFVLEVPSGRVCLYVVRGEHRSQIVAFCPAALRDVVERALARVRYVL